MWCVGMLCRAFLAELEADEADKVAQKIWAAARAWAVHLMPARALSKKAPSTEKYGVGCACSFVPVIFFVSFIQLIRHPLLQWIVLALCAF